MPSPCECAKSPKCLVPHPHPHPFCSYNYLTMAQLVASRVQDAATLADAWLLNVNTRPYLMDASRRHLGLGRAYSAAGVPFWTVVSRGWWAAWVRAGAGWERGAGQPGWARQVYEQRWADRAGQGGCRKHEGGSHACRLPPHTMPEVLAHG